MQSNAALIPVSFSRRGAPKASWWVVVSRETEAHAHSATSATRCATNHHGRPAIAGASYWWSSSMHAPMHPLVTHWDSEA